MPAPRTATDEEISCAAAKLEANSEPVTGPRLRHVLGTGRGNRCSRPTQTLTGLTQATHTPAIEDLG